MKIFTFSPILKSFDILHEFTFRKFDIFHPIEICSRSIDLAIAKIVEAKIKRIHIPHAMDFNSSQQHLHFRTERPLFLSRKTYFCDYMQTGLVIYWVKSNVTANHMQFAVSQEKRIFVLKEDPVDLKTWIEIRIWNEITFLFLLENDENYCISLAIRTFIWNK